jgi:hypothetical protein
MRLLLCVLVLVLFVACVITQNLYPKIHEILILKIMRICNFIGKYRLNVKDGGN